LKININSRKIPSKATVKHRRKNTAKTQGNFKEEKRQLKSTIFKNTHVSQKTFPIKTHLIYTNLTIIVFFCNRLFSIWVRGFFASV